MFDFYIIASHRASPEDKEYLFVGIRVRKGYDDTWNFFFSY